MSITRYGTTLTKAANGFLNKAAVYLVSTADGGPFLNNRAADSAARLVRTDTPLVIGSVTLCDIPLTKMNYFVSIKLAFTKLRDYCGQILRR